MRMKSRIDRYKMLDPLQSQLVHLTLPIGDVRLRCRYVLAISVLAI